MRKGGALSRSPGVFEQGHCQGWNSATVQAGEPMTVKKMDRAAERKPCRLSLLWMQGDTRSALVGVAACMLLCGCLPEQKDQIEKCRIDGKLAFIVSRQRWDESRTPAANYIHLCMEAAGYEWSWHGKFCQPTFDGSENSNPYCYRPKGAISKFLTDVEITQSGGFDDWTSEMWCSRMRSYTPEYCWTHGRWFPN